MALINLRDFYPYREDCFVEVSDEVAEVLYESERLEENYIRLLRWHGAYYTVDIFDTTIKDEALWYTLTPEVIYNRKAMVDELYRALHALPEIQRRRVFAHFMLDMNQAEIARVEGVYKSAVNKSIERGLRLMRKIILGN